MQGALPRKHKTGLSRETLIRIGTQLQLHNNEIVSQGVPDRFSDLLRRLSTGETIPEASSDEDFPGEKSPSSDKGS